MTRWWLRRLTFSIACALAVAVLTLPDHRDLPTPGGVRSGDLVFIRGKSVRSAVVCLLEGSDRAYSHVGLTVLEDGRPFIIHAEPAHDAASDRVMKEPWDTLVSPKRIAGATVFRVVTHTSGNALGILASNAAEQYWKEALPFDHDFDLMTSQKLYCTELVWRAYLTTGIDLRGNSFGSDRNYLLPSDLIRSGVLREIQPSP